MKELVRGAALAESALNDVLVDGGVVLAYALSARRQSEYACAEIAEMQKAKWEVQVSTHQTGMQSGSEAMAFVVPQKHEISPTNSTICTTLTTLRGLWV